ESERRKPKPGMILEAARALALDLSRSWLIGDAPRDIAAGHAAGCATILLKHSDLAQSPAAVEPGNVEPDFVAGSLAEALELIERATSGGTPLSASAPPAPQRPNDQMSHLVRLAEQILAEIKRRDEQTTLEFSITRLLAGVMQIVALAVSFVAYLNRSEQQSMALMGAAILLQLFTIALLLMGKDRDKCSRAFRWPLAPRRLPAFTSRT